MWRKDLFIRADVNCIYEGKPFRCVMISGWFFYFYVLLLLTKRTYYTIIIIEIISRRV